MPVNKKNLDQIAGRYHNQDPLGDKHIEDLCQRHTFGWVFSQLKGARRVLEMGHGDGIFTEELVRRGFRPVVLDGSKMLLDLALQRYGKKISCEHALYEEYRPQERFDAILATHVFEHVDAPVPLLKKMKSWLKPGGKIVIIVPNKESLHRRLAVAMKLQPALDTLSPRDKLVGHQRVYSMTTLKKDLDRAGYTSKNEAGFFLKALPNSMMLSYSPALLDALNNISKQLAPELMANIALVARPKGGR